MADYSDWALPGSKLKKEQEQTSQSISVDRNNPYADWSLQPQQAVEEKESTDDLSYWYDIPRSAALTIPDFAVGMVKGASEIAELVGIKQDRSGPTGKMLYEDWEPDNAYRSFVQAIGQFGMPAKIAAKGVLKVGTKILPKMPKTTRVASYALGGAAADFAAFDPNDPNLANFIGEHNEVLGPLRDLLATDPNDPEMTNRFRRAIEGVGLGIFADGLLSAVKAGWRGLKPNKKTLDITLTPAEQKLEQSARESVHFDPQTIGERTLEWARKIKNKKLMDVAEYVTQQTFDFALGAHKFDKFAKEHLKRQTTTYMSFRLSENISNLVQTFMTLGTARHNTYRVRKRGGRYWVIDNATRVGTPYPTKDQAFHVLHSLRNNAELLSTGGKSFEAILKPVVGSGEEENLALYLLSKRMEVLDKEGYVVPFSKAQRDLYIQNGNSARFEYEGQNYTYKQIEDDLKKFNSELMHFAVDSGLVSYQSAQKMLQRGSYLPLYRYFEDTVSGIPGREMRFGGSKGKLKYRLRGSGSEYPIDDPFRGLIANMTSILQESVRNRVRRDLYDTIDELHAKGFHEVNDFAERIPTKELPMFVNTDAIKSALKKAGVPIPQNIDDLDFYKIWARNKNMIANDIDIVFRNGKAHFYRVKDPTLQRTVAELGPRAALKLPIAVLRTAQFFKGALTMLTTLSPDFLAKNTIRDAASAWAFHKYGTAMPLVETYRGLRGLWKHDPSYLEWHANGGGNLGLHFVESGIMSKRLRKLAKGRGLNEGQFLPLGKMLTWWSNMAGALESANRYREYLRATESGASRRISALASREITTDFGLHGSAKTVKLLTSMVPFLNAGMQGFYRFARAAGGKEERKRLWLRTATGIITPTMGLWWLNRNLPEYQNLPEEIKDTNWVIPTRFFTPEAWKGIPNDIRQAVETSKYPVLLIPKPFELGAVASIVERGADQLIKADPAAAAASFERIIADMFRLSAMPQVISPIYDTAIANENWLGSKIVPKGLEGRVPWQQFTPYTGDLAVWIADKTKVPISPIQMEYLWNQYTGSIGAMVMDIADWAIRPQSKGAAPTPRLDDLPIFKSFLESDPYKNTPDKVQFYHINNYVQQIKTSYTAAKNDPVLMRTLPDSMIKYLSDPKNAVVATGIFKFFDEITKQAGSMDEAIGIILADPRISGVDKRIKIDNLTEEKNKLFANAMGKVMSDPVFRPLLPYRFKMPLMSGLNLGYHMGKIITSTPQATKSTEQPINRAEPYADWRLP